MLTHSRPTLVHPRSQQQVPSREVQRQHRSRLGWVRAEQQAVRVGPDGGRVRDVEFFQVNLVQEPGEVPELDAVVDASGRQERRVPAEAEAVDGVCVSRKFGQEVPVGHVPEEDLAVGATRREEAAVVAELEAVDAALVARHVADAAARQDVPEAHRPVARPGCHVVGVVVELDAVNVGDVTCGSEDGGCDCSDCLQN